MGADGRIVVLVLDDQLVVGQGVASALEATGEFVSDGVMTSLAEVEHRVSRRQEARAIDAVVADIDLGDETALMLPALIGPSGPPVVFLSGHDEPAIVRAAIQSGAAAFVHKRTSTDRLADAIRRAVAGQTTFSRDDLARVRAAPRMPSGRELQVLRGIVRGLANKAMAVELEIEERTVEAHIRRMLDRYGSSNRTELAVLALRQGWVDIGGRARP